MVWLWFGYVYLLLGVFLQSLCSYGILPCSVAFFPIFKFLMPSLSKRLTGYITETVISNFLLSCSRFINWCSFTPSLHLCVSSYNFLAKSYNMGCYLQLLFIEPSYVCEVPVIRTAYCTTGQSCPVSICLSVSKRCVHWKQSSVSFLEPSAVGLNWKLYLCPIDPNPNPGNFCYKGSNFLIWKPSQWLNCTSDLKIRPYH